MLALAAGVLLFLLRERRLRKALIWAMPAFLLFAAGFALTPPGKRFSNRLYQWKQDPGGPRAMLWKQTPQLFLAHPLAGTGPETFAIEFRKIESAEMSRAYPDFYHETPHNVFLDAAVAQGVPGILVLAGLLWITARTGHSGLQAALTGIWVSSLFASFTLMEWLLLWTLAGLARPGSGGRIQLPQWAATIAGIAGFVIAASAYLLTVPDIEGQRLLRAVARKDQAAAYRACDLARSNGFGLPGYQLFFSRQLAILGRSLGNTPKAQVAWRTSAEFAARAEIESEEPFAAALQSGVVAVTFGDLTRAEEKARESIQLAPNWYQPHLFLASVLEVMGRTQEARAERAAGERLRH